MKTKKELNDLKNEFEALNNKLHELTKDELTEVAGGTPHFASVPKSSEQDKKIMETYKKDINIDKNAKVIFL